MDDSGVIIRDATRKDCQAIVNLSKELSEHHKHPDSPHVDVKVLERDLFDVENSNVGILVAEIDGDVIGYAHFIYTYVIRLGKNMMIRDLYVQEKYRNKKVGDELVKAIAKKASAQNMSKIQFVLTDWNPARRFYQAKGAIDLTKTEKYNLLAIDRDAIEKIAST